MGDLNISEATFDLSNEETPALLVVTTKTRLITLYGKDGQWVEMSPEEADRLATILDELPSMISWCKK